MHHVLTRAVESRPREQESDTRAAVERAIERGEATRDLVAELDALASKFERPARTGFEPAVS
jgi:hypothetical protein